MELKFHFLKLMISSVHSVKLKISRLRDATERAA